MIKPKGLLIALVLLAVLGGLTYWSNKNKAADTSKTGGDTANKVLSIPGGPDPTNQSAARRRRAARAAP